MGLLSQGGSTVAGTDIYAGQFERWVLNQEMMYKQLNVPYRLQEAEA